ncbi:tyrosine-type recombinase/integrase [Cryobacterium levicorallinum]|uniref:Phage integrase family protein n=1 Tax=Cryobacterium levicorallinum TaxID=995038 RepID=A0ABY1EH36_9MICO|nr:tyrosine-type recombinase/integrase [Cryobacterium levicorallinum]GEP28255.1 site-specific integrase [Cryobacterium levicorallinum]SFH83297.1 Phage integrase family protein [Cryobacterium levicorallinum]
MTKAKAKVVKRSAPGEGSFKFDKSTGLWVGRVTLPTGIDGKQHRRKVTSRDEAEGKKKFAAAKREAARGGIQRTSNPTTGAYLMEWLGTVATRPRTKDSYEANLRLYIIPALGKIRILHLGYGDVLKMTQGMTARGLSSTTARTAHTILSTALTAAVNRKVIDWNPAKAILRPKAAVVEGSYLTVAQTTTLLRSNHGDRMEALWALYALTGCREGEGLGLTIDRVDLTPGAEIIDLSWQLQRLRWEHAPGCVDPKTRKAACSGKRGADCPGRHIVTPDGFEMKVLAGALVLTRPKTASSNRMVPLVSPLLELITARVAAATAEHNPLGLLFTGPAHVRKLAGNPFFEGGAPWNPSACNLAWHRALADAGIEEERKPVYSLHSTRHSAVTVLAAMGVPISVRMQITGHASTKAHTGYNHNDELAEAREALKQMGKLFS